MIKSSCSNKDNKMKIWSAEENEGGVDLKINMPGFGKDDVQVNEMKAGMKNGVLKIIIPKVVEEEKEKTVVQIQIE
ncbi:hypothetical protein MKW94_002667 [Papaver nudicaule]|uniref:SHSP domain-containing protein n=1 Tax=Papaver nudicaule TaxID=74823 RepID=A0AA42AXE0_PAPNU|nr:hypothetical protein [Papaver nudicaule]